MFYIFLSGHNSRNIQDIKFKFSAVLNLVEATKNVKFQSARCTGIKVGIFRISPIFILYLRRAWVRRIYLFPSVLNTCACGTFRYFPVVHMFLVECDYSASVQHALVAV